MSKIVNFPNGYIKNQYYANNIKNFVFGMYSHKMTYEDGTWRQHWFIVLKHKHTGVILEITPYSKFLRFLGKKKSVGFRRPETLRVRGYFICNFLNYVLIAMFDKFQISTLRDITLEHGNQFLQAYADGEASRDKKRKPESTVAKVAVLIAKFYEWIQDVYGKEAKYIKGIKMIEKVEYVDHSSGKKGTNSITPFNVHVADMTHETIFRDIPNKALSLLINLSKVYYPEMTLGLCLEAFAGLRIGEVCNVRQDICPLDGGGISYQKIGGRMSGFKINLLNKYPMRSDGVDVGGIKKYRQQYVYPKFLPLLEPIYKEHIKWLEKQKNELGYYPMFVNRNGHAETSQNYRKKFYTLIENYLIPALIDSEDYELQVYAEMLMTRQLAPHALRHWFTVQLVLNNEQPHSIAGWRGDDSLDTALDYTRNKSQLLKLYKAVTTDLLQDINNVDYYKDFMGTK